MKKLIVGVLAVTMFGCGVDSLRKVDDGATPGGPSTEARPGSPTPGTPPGGNGNGTVEGTRTALRIKGVDIGNYSALLAQVRDARVLVDGRRIDVEVDGDFVDLARDGHAWTVGTFALPAGAKQVEVELEFDDYGGFQTDSAAGMVNLRVPNVRFVAPAAYFAEHSHAVLHLNLNRSLQALDRAGELQLLPDFQVHY